MKGDRFMKEGKKNNLGIILLVALVIIIAVVIAVLLLTNKKYTINFSNVAGYNSVEVKKGKTLTKPADPTKDGYRFVGWYYQDELFDFSTEITKNITLEARFEAIGDTDSEKFTVLFNTDGGNSIENQIIEENEKASKPSDPVKEGYTFVEWQLNGKAYNFNSKVTSDITLKAIWKENSSSSDDDDNQVKKYTVTFNSNGGSSVAKQQIVSGKTVTKPGNPTRDGYQFVEWQLNGKTYHFSSKVTKNITLTAKWKSTTTPVTPTVQKYTVTFNSNGGSNVANQEVESGKTATKPGNPTRSGYKFVEWQLNGKAYNFSSKVTGNITLTAKWEANTTPVTPTVQKYTVTFNSNGGSNVASQEVESGKTATKPGNPTRSGYKFVEWQFNGKAYNFSSKVTGNITLTAKWEQEITYTYKAEALDLAGISYKVYVYKNGTDYTASAGAVYTSAGAYLGRYDATEKAIIVDKSKVSSIGAIKVNGNLVNLSR